MNAWIVRYNTQIALWVGVGAGCIILLQAMARAASPKKQGKGIQ